MSELDQLALINYLEEEDNINLVKCLSNKFKITYNDPWQEHYYHLLTQLHRFHADAISAAILLNKLINSTIDEQSQSIDDTLSDNTTNASSEFSVSHYTNNVRCYPCFAKYFNKNGEENGIIMQMNKRFFNYTTENSSKWAYIRKNALLSGYIGAISKEEISHFLLKIDDNYSFYKVNNFVFHTYLFSIILYSPCYRHPENEAWMVMPISVEAMLPRSITAIKKIREKLGDLTIFEILATLRACNYNIQECIETLEIARTLGLIKADKINRSIVSWVDVLDTISFVQNENKILKAKVDKLQPNIDNLVMESANLDQKIKVLTKEESNLNANIKKLESELQKLQGKSKSFFSKIFFSKPTEVEKIKLNFKPVKANNLQLRGNLMTTKNDLKNQVININSCFFNIIKAVGKLNTMSDNEIHQQLEYCEAKYKEVELKRKLLYNQLQQQLGNIRVYLRCRPPPEGCKLCFTFEHEDTVGLVFNNRDLKYTFYKVFRPSCKQEDLFLEIESLITSCIDGYNVCIVAYGQTGSGKTHTMQGYGSPGLSPRAIACLLNKFKEYGQWAFTMTISMIEIYKEIIQDLLGENIKQVDVCEIMSEVTIPNLTEIKVVKNEDIEKALTLGAARRKVAETKMNGVSSRSHLIYMIKVFGKNNVHGAQCKGILALCDLAGSEDVTKSGVEGNELREAIKINASLSCLGRVLDCLHRRQVSIPYRDSKLTHMLKPFLGGDAKFVLFINVRSDDKNLSETNRTLQFGSSAAKISLGIAKKHTVK